MGLLLHPQIHIRTHHQKLPQLHSSVVTWAFQLATVRFAQKYTSAKGAKLALIDNDDVTTITLNIQSFIFKNCDKKANYLTKKLQ